MIDDGFRVICGQIKTFTITSTFFLNILRRMSSQIVTTADAQKAQVNPLFF